MPEKPVPAGSLSKRASPRGFALAVVWLTLLSLWPIWQSRLLPMQDYPQHLFVAHVTATEDDPSLNWADHYDVALRPSPYSSTYFAMRAMAFAVDTETAGKMLLSLYVLVVALLAFTVRRALPAGAGWPALVLFPLAFHQMYFLGFVNFILSVPLLILALIDLERFVARSLSVRTVSRHLLFLALLFLTHPYTVLVYIALAGVGAAATAQRWRELAHAMFPAAFLLVAFLLWFANAPVPSEGAPGAAWGVRWWPPAGTVPFYLLMFTGMRWSAGIDWLSVTGWTVVATLITVSVRDTRFRFSRRIAFYIGAALVGYALLPFWFSYYSYFNLRLAPVSLFLIAWGLSRVRLSPSAAYTLVAAVSVLVLVSAGLQRRVSAEKADLLPLLEKMEPNRRLLPLPFATASEILDPGFFYQIHHHDPNYYHVVTGGGANPSLFPNPWLPVQYREGVVLPAPEVLTHFKWEDYEAYYDYVLARGAPRDFVEYLSEYTDVVQSGKWTLFRK